MSQTADSAFQPRRTRLRRGLLFVVAALLVITLSWGPALYRKMCLAWGQAAIERADFRSAERWLANGNWGDLEAEHQFWRGRLERKLGRLDEMIVHLQRAADLGWDRDAIELETWLAGAQSGDLSQLGPHLNDLLIEGREQPEVCEAFVNGCILNYRLDDALQLIDLWMQDYPEDPRPHFLKGRILEHRGSSLPAAEMYQAALELQPSFSAAAFNLCRVLTEQQDYESALAQAENCRDHHYDPQPGWVAMARCQRLMQQFAEARHSLDEASRSSGESVEVAWRLVGEPLETAQVQVAAEYGLIAIAEDDFSSAAQWMRKVVDSNPSDWKSRYQLALALRSLGQIEDAESELAKVEATQEALASCDILLSRLRADPSDVEARLAIGKTFIEHLSVNQGLVWLNSVLAYDRNNVESHRILAEYYAAHLDENPEFADLAERHRRFLPADSSAPAPDEGEGEL